MKFPKITKTLPLVLALAMTTSCAFAEESVPADTSINNEQNAVYQLSLDTFFDIDVKAPVDSTTSFDDDYTSITIDSAVVGAYKVVSNTNEKNFYLYATCPTSGGPQPALYGSLGSLKIVLTNTETQADPAAVTYITNGGTPVEVGSGEGATTVSSSENAISFLFTETYKHEETPTNGWLDSGYTFNAAKGEIAYKVANGKHTLTYSIAGNAQDNSFSTLDTRGTYQATLVLTDVQKL